MGWSRGPHLVDGFADNRSQSVPVTKQLLGDPAAAYKLVASPQSFS